MAVMVKIVVLETDLIKAALVEWALQTIAIGVSKLAQDMMSVGFAIMEAVVAVLLKHLDLPLELVGMVAVAMVQTLSLMVVRAIMAQTTLEAVVVDLI